MSGSAPLGLPIESGPARRWPAVVIALATVAVLVAAVAFVATSDGPTDTAAGGPTTTTAPIRACVQPPRTTTTTTMVTTAPPSTVAADPAAPVETAAPPEDPADPAEPADPTDTTTPPSATEPPDGTYLGSILPETRSTVVLTILTPGSEPIAGVPLGPDVVAPSGPTGGAVTVRDGVIEAIDTSRVTWDEGLGRGDLPCTPDTGCEALDEEPPHAWPFGVDGTLGDDVAEVPTRLAAILAKWTVEVDPVAMRLGAAPCTIAVALGHVTATARLGLLDDGSFVLTAVTTDDEAASGPWPEVTVSGADLAVPLSAEAAAVAPTATVDLAVRYGDRTTRAQAASSASSVDASVTRRANQRGAYVLVYTEADGSVRRLVAAQLPAGDLPAT